MNKITKNVLILLLVTVLIVGLGCEVEYLSNISKPSVYTIQVVENNKQPSYKEIKSHAVYIVGCADEISKDISMPFFQDDKKGVCWGGSGVVIKITETETYILTNNHISGLGMKNPRLKVENETLSLKEEFIDAELVANNKFVDMAVIKIKAHLNNKTAIKKISFTLVQDKIYIVGNPLNNKMIYTEGIKAGIIGTDDLYQAPCIFGNSGSGIFDKDGNLVGLVYALQMYPGFLGFPSAQITHTLSINPVFIKMFLEELKLYEE